MFISAQYLLRESCVLIFIAAVTNYKKFNGLKRYTSVGQKFRINLSVLKLRSFLIWAPSEGSWGISISYLFQFLEATYTMFLSFQPLPAMASF